MAHHAYIFRYRVRTWRTYNQVLIAQGGMTFWIDESALAAWKHPHTNRRPGAPRTYAHTAIHCALVVKSVDGLSLRAAQGFVSSVMSLMRLDLPVPNYSTICRRQGALRVSVSASLHNNPRHIVIDATGLRVYGAGEWPSQKHQGSQRCLWRKLHLGVDEHTKEIVAVEITASHVHDSQVLPRLLTQVSGTVCQVSGDGAYDTKACYRSIGQRGAKATIPPRRNARQRRCENSLEKLDTRDANLCEIQSPGRYAWRVVSGCTRQSLAENAVFRFKSLVGARFRARRFDNQRVEGWIKCMVLNRMVNLGMPVSERIC